MILTAQADLVVGKLICIKSNAFGQNYSNNKEVIVMYDILSFCRDSVQMSRCVGLGIGILHGIFRYFYRHPE